MLPLTLRTPPSTHPQLSHCHAHCGTARLHPCLQATLLNACIIGGCNVAGTLVSILLADLSGRRGLLLQGGVQVGARSCCCR